MDEKFILATDILTKKLIMFNRELRVTYKVSVPKMVQNFPYVKVKNGTIAYVTNLDKMKFHYLGVNNGMLLTKQQQTKDPYDNPGRFRDYLDEGRTL